MDIGTFLGKMVALQTVLDDVAVQRRDLEQMASQSETFKKLLLVWKLEVINSLRIDLITKEPPEIERVLTESEQTPPEEKGVNP